MMIIFAVMELTGRTIALLKYFQAAKCTLILTRNVIAIVAKCNSFAKCNKINVRGKKSRKSRKIEMRQPANVDDKKSATTSRFRNCNQRLSGTVTCSSRFVQLLNFLKAINFAKGGF